MGERRPYISREPRVALLRRCASCRFNLPLDAFGRRAAIKDGINTNCRKCVCDRALAHYYRNPVLYAQKRIKIAYGLDAELYAEMLEEQEHRCAVCNRELASMDVSAKSGNGRAVDHCHSTGRVRSILCTRCNLVLGHVNDAPGLLRQLADYLEAA